MRSCTHRIWQTGRLAALLVTLAVLWGTLGAGICMGASEPPVTSVLKEKAFTYSGYLVMEAESGRILDGDGYDNRLSMASTTKIMTTLLTLESENLDQPFTVDSLAIHVEGSSMGLLEGDVVTLRTLACGMLLESGNDGANAAAVRIAGSIPAFAKRMNQRAAEIGMTGTNFVTPSGLDAEEHYTTAYDMALLAREALKNPDFLDICSQPSMIVEFGNPAVKRTFRNHNRLLTTYEGAIGVKTGFTKKSGRCLVSAVEREGITLICVTLNCYDDWNAHITAYDHAFTLVERIPASNLLENLPSLLSGQSCQVAGGVEEQVALETVEEPMITLLKGDAGRLEAKIEKAPIVFAPVEKGRVLGQVKLYLDGVEVEALPLAAARDVEARPVTRREGGESFWRRFFRWIGFG